MPAAQRAVSLGQDRDDVVQSIIGCGPWLVVGDVQVFAADEADAQHDLGHDPAP